MAHILILEDDEELADQIARFLDMDGHTAVVFPDIVSATAHFEAHSVDLVIVDIFIEDGSEGRTAAGISFISSVRQVNDTWIPVIAISGSFEGNRNFSRKQLVSTAKTVGATRTLAKPFHPAELSDVVEELLAKRAEAGD